MLLLCLIISPPNVIADNFAPDFEHDSGLNSVEINSDVSQLRFSVGVSHYRMRFYEFYISGTSVKKNSTFIS